MSSTLSTYHERSMPHREIQDLFDEVVKTCYPRLKENGIYWPLEGKESYGDFAFYGVVDICNHLRKRDPNLFEHTSPKKIAKVIRTEFISRKYPMIKTLSIHDAGILTFSIEGSWIANRINKMLELGNGINRWAPALFNVKKRRKAGKALFVFPPNPCIASEMVRAKYIKDVIENVYLYSEAEFGCGYRDDEAMRATDACFQKKQGKIVSKLHKTSFSEPIDVDAFADLATLWNGVKTQKADMMVHMTPHRLRGYIESCHNAAANEGWLPHDWKKRGTVTCCGFRAFGHEQQTMANLWARIHCEPAVLSRLEELCIDGGYRFPDFFEYALKFACLKSHRLAECLFTYEDLVDEKACTLASLLKTQALISSFIKNSPGRDFKLHELTEKEHDLGFHILKFTEVIERVGRAFVPHVLCEYVYDLSQLFTSCFPEVKHGKNILGLCKATEVVMTKCIKLLGISPFSCRYRDSYDCMPFFEASEDTLTSFRKTHPSEDARIEHNRQNSRLEIFTMFVGLGDSKFKEGSVYGTVRVLDTFRSANGRGWVGLDENDDCYVSYITQEWYEAVPIYNCSFVPLGNPSSFRSISFSSAIKVELLMNATSEEKDQSYMLCNRNRTVLLESFWDGPLNASCGTIKFDYPEDDGCIKLHYVVIKQAVDTTMRLTFMPSRNVRLSGSITASYGKNIIGEERGLLGQYTALIFRANPEFEYTTREKPYLLDLYKSTMAVPKNTHLEMKANIMEAVTNRRLADGKKDISLKESDDKESDDDNTWTFGCAVGVFVLTVERC